MKYSILLIFFLLAFIPFVFLNDFYPFFRFGMFAESNRLPIQQERLFLSFQNLEGKEFLFDPQSIGFEAVHFSYILRDYVYRNKGLELLENVHRLMPQKKEILIWEIRKTAPDSDTLSLIQWKCHEKTF